MTKEERREKPCYVCGKPEYVHLGGRFCENPEEVRESFSRRYQYPELDSEWLRLISRCYMATEDMKDRMTRIAERIAGLEELEELTRVEMERLEMERGGG